MMSDRQQLVRYDKMLFTNSHRAEMKLREMARNVVDEKTDFVGDVALFPVVGIYSAEQSRNRFYAIRVRLNPAIKEREARLLIAEAIIRPQLKEAGWAV
jgi:hypothetical protein